MGVVGCRVRRLIEADGTVARLGEETVEDPEVEVEVGVEGLHVSQDVKEVSFADYTGNA